MAVVGTLVFHMPGMDGLACLDRIMLEHPCPVVMVSSLTEAGADITLQALDMGAVDFVPKPGGAISLKLDVLGPRLVETVRAASRARLPGTYRLRERVRLRTRAMEGAFAEPPRHDGGARAVHSVVLVGTSTGGPPALDALIQPLLADFPAPILVAQHMPASFTGPLARRLNQMSALEVIEVTRPVPLVPGTVYIGRGDADLIVGVRQAGLVAMSAPASAEHRWHPSVDRLVASAMQHIGAKRLVGVLMTGMGHDGAATMTELRQGGGVTIAEAEETAVVWGMPGELVRAGGASHVVPLDKIAGRLLDLVAAG
jgi:two-component system chemotaxis response regulator CheB